MVADIYFDVDADILDLQRVLALLAMRISPAGAQTFLETIVDPYIRARIKLRFAGEGDDASGAWVALAAATERIRAHKGFPAAHPINVRTTKLKDFLINSRSDVKASAVGATLMHPPPTGDAEVRKKIVTAQMGSRFPRTPPRPVIGVNENDLIFITAALSQWIVDGI